MKAKFPDISTSSNSAFNVLCFYLIVTSFVTFSSPFTALTTTSLVCNLSYTSSSSGWMPPPPSLATKHYETSIFTSSSPFPRPITFRFPSRFSFHRKHDLQESTPPRGTGQKKIASLLHWQRLSHLRLRVLDIPAFAFTGT